MREIKFRAWDKKNKGWLTGVDFNKDLRMSMSGGLSINSKIAERHNLDIHQIELTQYTGLKDKNGKEVYERDIVKREVRNDFGSMEIMTLAVMYCEHKGSWSLTKTPEDPEKPHYIMGNTSKNTEIIGNTKENPELLK